MKKDKLQIICFQGYGTNDRLPLRCRALEDEIIDLEQKGFLAVVLKTWKRFETDEIKHAKIKVKAGGSITLKANTDTNGYYLKNEFVEYFSRFANTEGWLPVAASFATDNLNRSINDNNCFVGEMLIPCADADYGVIDDTILHTGVVSSLKWRVLVNTIFKRAGSLDALEGTADLS